MFTEKRDRICDSVSMFHSKDPGNLVKVKGIIKSGGEAKSRDTKVALFQGYHSPQTQLLKQNMLGEQCSRQAPPSG